MRVTLVIVAHIWHELDGGDRSNGIEHPTLDGDRAYREDRPEGRLVLRHPSSSCAIAW